MTSKRQSWLPAEVEEAVVKLVASEMKVEQSEVVRKTSFKDDLGAESLDNLEMVMQLEDQFELVIPDKEAEKLLTVGAAIDQIQSQLRTLGRLD